MKASEWSLFIYEERYESGAVVVEKNKRYVRINMRSEASGLSRLETWSPVVTKTVKFTWRFPGPQDRRGVLTRPHGLEF